MGSPSEKVKNAIAGLKNNFLFWDKEERAEEAKLSLSDARRLGHILEAYQLGYVMDRSERFAKPATVSVMRSGLFPMKDTV